MPAPAPEAPPKTVLVVDDDAFIGRAVACILREARGANVCLARSGDEALPLAIDLRPDVILMDVHMPGMTVLEFCRRLRELPDLADAALYLLTGVLPCDGALDPLRPYVRGVLNKPPNPAELLAALDYCHA